MIARKSLITVGLTTGIRFANVALTLTTSVLLARLLGIDEFGLYSFVYALVLIVSIPARMGLPQLVLRETAYANRSGETGKIRAIWRWATGTALAISLTITAIACLAVFIFEDRVANPWVVIAGMALIPLISLGNLRSASLRGIGWIVTGQLPELLLRPAFFVSVLGYIYFAREFDNLAAIDAMLINASCALAAFVVGSGLLLYAARTIADGDKETFGDRKLIYAAMSLGAIAGLTAINNNLDILMIGFWLTEREVGLYKPAAAIADAAMFGMQVINVIIMPRIASMYRGGQLEQIEALVRKATLAGGASGFAAFALIAVIGEVLLSTLFGAAYSAGYIALLILAFGQAVNASFGAAAGLLNMSGFENRTLRAIGVSVGVNFVLNALLISFMGINGAALATLLSVWCYKYLLTRDIKRFLGVRTNFF